jgi:hypothetical protein
MHYLLCDPATAQHGRDLSDKTILWKAVAVEQAETGLGQKRSAQPERERFKEPEP